MDDEAAKPRRQFLAVHDVGKTFQIGSIMQTGKKLGMVTLNDSLAKLVEAKVCEPLEAYSKAADRAEFEKLLSARGIQLNLDDCEKGRG